MPNEVVGLIFVIVFATVVLTALGGMLFYFLKSKAKNEKMCNRVCNFDSLETKCVFRINQTKERLYAQLAVPGVLEDLWGINYKFDNEKSILVFKRFEKENAYELGITECDNFCILRLTLMQHPIISRRVISTLKMNSLWVEKFNAIALPFDEYAF